MKVLIILGTRPEAIKLAPLIKQFESDSFFDHRVCLTGQHREMLNQVLKFFDIEHDYNLDVMKENQSLFNVSASILTEMEYVLDDFKPDIVFVQGDTSTAFIGALSAFYKKYKIAHLEAGLRSGDLQSPFPEEANRKLISVIADYNFVPTALAKENLLKENCSGTISVVGNTVIDALLLGLHILETKGNAYNSEFEFLEDSKKTILVTAHRRESFGKPLEDICDAILEISQQFSVQIVFPVHFNPNVQSVVTQKLSNSKNVHLIEPLDYPRLIWLMKKSYLIITDSGGIQEEAPTLGKPVLVTRNVTERIEGIEAGTAELVGTAKDIIIEKVVALLNNDHELYDRMSRSVNPYGDGTASQQIIDILKS